MNTKIQTLLISRGAISGLVNVIDGLHEILLGLCKTYIPGVGNRYKGLRPYSAEGISIPCIMVQFMDVDPKMRTNIKYEKFYLFDFWFIVGDDSVEGAHVAGTDMAEIFMKLFSNNALNDRDTVGTNQFKTYGSNWIDSEMAKVECTVPFLSGRPNGPRYIVLGNFQLRLQTVTQV